MRRGKLIVISFISDGRTLREGSQVTKRICLQALVVVEPNLEFADKPDILWIFQLPSSKFGRLRSTDREGQDEPRCVGPFPMKDIATRLLIYINTRY
jgi:hypothetical protein